MPRNFSEHQSNRSALLRQIDLTRVSCDDLLGVMPEPVGTSASATGVVFWASSRMTTLSLSVRAAHEGKRNHLNQSLSMNRFTCSKSHHVVQRVK